ncbi:MAG: PqqD family protein [Clostridia bacterium]|nr:PqqD family protein [Clostridia bacterium]
MTNETFKIKSGYVLREIEGEFLAIPFAPELNSANVIILNPVSGLIWEKLQTECTLSQLVKAVTENFSIDAVTAQGDIEEFLQTLKENDMLE